MVIAPVRAGGVCAAELDNPVQFTLMLEPHGSLSRHACVSRHACERLRAAGKAKRALSFYQRPSIYRRTYPTAQQSATFRIEWTGD